MSLSQLDGLIWLLCTLLPFLFIQRWLHHEIQAFFLLITRRMDVALGIFSLLFFPGVLLHETSHYLMAKLLRVRTGRFSLLPKTLEDGQLQLGFVETQNTDLLRTALIGSAPLFAGGAVVALLGIYQLGLGVLIDFINQGKWESFWSAVLALPQHPDFFFWFYLAFVVSSTMMPSESDRMAWMPLFVTVIAVLILSILAGAGPWMLEHIAPLVNNALKAVGLVFGISLILHLILGIPLKLLRELLMKVTKVRI